MIMLSLHCYLSNHLVAYIVKCDVRQIPFRQMILSCMRYFYYIFKLTCYSQVSFKKTSHFLHDNNNDCHNDM